MNFYALLLDGRALMYVLAPSRARAEAMCRGRAITVVEIPREDAPDLVAIADEHSWLEGFLCRERAQELVR